MSIPISERIDVVLTDIRHGSPTTGRENIIYAKVVDMSGDLLVSATLDYILKIAKERGYNFKAK